MEQLLKDFLAKADGITKHFYELAVRQIILEGYINLTVAILTLITLVISLYKWRKLYKKVQMEDGHYHRYPDSYFAWIMTAICSFIIFLICGIFALLYLTNPEYWAFKSLIGE